MQRILVTGARAKTGAPLVDLLRDRSDVDVLAGSRDPSKLDHRDALPVAFDWDDRTTWNEAVSDIDAVFVVRPDREDAPRLVADLVAATPEHTHVVLLSEVDNGYFSDDSWAMNVERVVRNSGRTWTLLRPGWFMQVFTDPRFLRTEITENGRLPFVSDGQKVAWIDTRDIAAVAEQALMKPDHQHKIYELSGPEAMTLEHTADLLTRALGRPVQHEELSMDDVLGDSEGFQRRNDYGAFDRIRLGVAGNVTHTVEEITGRGPHSFEQFLTDHADQLKSD